MRKKYSSILLTILVVFTQFVLFGQSKKKLNSQLISKHDSLVKVIQLNQHKVDSATLLVQKSNDSLLASIANFKSPKSKENLTYFKNFYENIATCKENFKTESSQYFEELNNRYILLNEKEFELYMDQINSISSSNKNLSNRLISDKNTLNNLMPTLILPLKTGNKTEWNERIFEQNQSLNFYTELQDKYIQFQLSRSSYLNEECNENMKFYKEFYSRMEETKIEAEKLYLQHSLWMKEREKKEAESARLEALYWKKNKGKTIQFIPPVITDQEINPIQMESQQSFDEETPKQKFVQIETKQEPVVEMKPEKRQEEEIYTIVDESAEFPGGTEALKAYLKDNLKYPESAREIAIEGKVYLKFIISKKGEISNVSVLRGINECNECNKEAIRLIKSMPKWKPAKVNLKEVHSYYTIPVIFKID
jgi:protein TonB